MMRRIEPSPWLLLGVLLFGQSVLLLVALALVHDAAPFFGSTVTLKEFLISGTWSPSSDPPSFGIVHAWISSLVVCAGSLALAVPLGLGIGVFSAEIAPRWMRALLQPCLEMLAGVPSVVYGFFGTVTLVALFESRLNMATGECLVIAIFILALMILPFIASGTAEALRAVPDSLRESALALGVTRSHCIRRILLRAARPGICAAIALGLARAAGETLAVLMLAGNSSAVPASLFDRGQPIPALIATELGEAAVGSPKYSALAASGAVLMGMVVLINALVWSFRRQWVKPQ